MSDADRSGGEPAWHSIKTFDALERHLQQHPFDFSDPKAVSIIEKAVQHHIDTGTHTPEIGERYKVLIKKQRLVMLNVRLENIKSAVSSLSLGSLSDLAGIVDDMEKWRSRFENDVEYANLENRVRECVFPAAKLVISTLRLPLDIVTRAEPPPIPSGILPEGTVGRPLYGAWESEIMVTCGILRNILWQFMTDEQNQALEKQLEDRVPEWEKGAVKKWLE